MLIRERVLKLWLTFILSTSILFHFAKCACPPNCPTLYVPHTEQQVPCDSTVTGHNCNYDNLVVGTFLTTTLLSEAALISMYGGVFEDVMPFNNCAILQSAYIASSSIKIRTIRLTFKDAVNGQTYPIKYADWRNAPDKTVNFNEGLITSYGACFNANKLKGLYFCEASTNTPRILAISAGDGNCYQTGLDCSNLLSWPNQILTETVATGHNFVGFRLVYDDKGDGYDRFDRIFGIKAIYNSAPGSCTACQQVTQLTVNSMINDIVILVNQNSVVWPINAQTDVNDCPGTFTYDLQPSTYSQIRINGAQSNEIHLGTFSVGFYNNYNPNPQTFTLTVTEAFGETYTKSFKLTIARNCEILLPTSPAEGDVFQYPISLSGSQPMTIYFPGLSVEPCFYSLQMTVQCCGGSPSTLTAGTTFADTFLFTDRVLELQANSWTSTTSPSFTIQTNQQGLYSDQWTVKLTVFTYTQNYDSQAPAISDPVYAQATREFKLDFVLKCNPTLPTLSSKYTYRYSLSNGPSPALIIPFTGAFNDNCAWDESLVIVEGASTVSLPVDDMVYTQMTATTDAGDSLFTDVNPGNLKIETTDECYAGITKTFRYTLTQLVDSTGLDAVSKNFNVFFDYDFECVHRTPASITNIVDEVKYDTLHVENDQVVSMTFEDAMDGDCESELTLVQINPSPTIAGTLNAPFSFDPGSPNISCGRITGYTTPPIFSISTSQVSAWGEYDFRLQVKEVYSNLNALYNFKVIIFGSCMGEAWRGVAYHNFKHYSYQTNNEAITIELSGMDREKCFFAIRLANAIRDGATQPVDVSSFMTIVQPQFHQVTGSVEKSGKILVEAIDPTLAGAYTLNFTLSSNNIDDTWFVIYLDMISCDPFIESTSSLAVSYTLGDPELTFKMRSNATDSCFNSEFSVVNSTGSPQSFDGLVFTIRQFLEQKWISLTMREMDQSELGYLGMVYEFAIIEKDKKTGLSRTQNYKVTISGQSNLINGLDQGSQVAQVDEVMEEVAEEDEHGIMDWQSKFMRSKKQEKLEPLVALVQQITPFGNVTIQFNKPILLPPIIVSNWTEFISGKEHQQSLSRNLSKQYDIKEILRVQVKSFYYEESDEQIRILDYIVTDLREYELDIWIDFNQPNQITQSIQHPDELEIIFMKGNMFMDSVDYSQLEKNFTLSLEIVPQVSITEFEEMKSFEAAVQQSIAMFSVAQLIINLLLSYGLKFLWNMMNTLQFIIFMQLWQIQLPQQVNILLQQLKMLVLFEFIPTKEIKNFLFNLVGIDTGEDEEGSQVSQEDSTEDESQKVGLQRTGSTSLVENMGMMLLILIIMLAFIAIFMIIYILSRKSARIQAIVVAIKRMIFFNAFIRYALQSDLKLSLSSGSLLAQKIENSESEITTKQFVISAVILAICTSFPLIFFACMQRYRGKLETKEVRNKIGSLYLGLIGKANYVWAYQAMFFLRRTLFVWLTFYLFSLPGIQLQVMCFLNVIQMEFIIHTRLHEFTWQRYLETVNEMLLLFMCYHFILFHDLLSSVETKALVGQSFRILVFVCIAINTAVIIWCSVKQFQAKLRLKKSKLEYMRKEEERIFQAKLDAMKRTPIKVDNKPNFLGMRSLVYQQVYDQMNQNIKLKNSFEPNNQSNMGLVSDGLHLKKQKADSSYSISEISLNEDMQVNQAIQLSLIEVKAKPLETHKSIIVPKEDMNDIFSQQDLQLTNIISQKQTGAEVGQLTSFGLPKMIDRPIMLKERNLIETTFRQDNEIKPIKSQINFLKQRSGFQHDYENSVDELSRGRQSQSHSSNCQQSQQSSSQRSESQVQDGSQSFQKKKQENVSVSEQNSDQSSESQDESFESEELSSSSNEDGERSKEVNQSQQQPNLEQKNLQRQVTNSQQSSSPSDNNSQESFSSQSLSSSSVSEAKHSVDHTTNTITPLSNQVQANFVNLKPKMDVFDEKVLNFKIKNQHQLLTSNFNHHNVGKLYPVEPSYHKDANMRQMNDFGSIKLVKQDLNGPFQNTNDKYLQNVKTNAFQFSNQGSPLPNSQLMLPKQSNMYQNSFSNRVEFGKAPSPDRSKLSYLSNFALQSTINQQKPLSQRQKLFKGQLLQPTKMTEPKESTLGSVKQSLFPSLLTPEDLARIEERKMMAQNSEFGLLAQKAAASSLERSQNDYFNRDVASKPPQLQYQQSNGHNLFSRAYNHKF